MKKFYLTVTAILAVLLLTACGFGGDNNPAKDTNDSDAKEGTKEKELHLVVGSEPPSLNPQLATDTTSSSFILSLFEGLTRLDENGDPKEAIAENIAVSEDGLTYTFTLRDAKWTNGDTVTASDFAYAWLWALNPENVAEYATQFYTIKGGEAYNNGKGKQEDVAIEAKDDKTLIVTLEQPTPYFLALTATHPFTPLNEKVVTNNPKWYADAGEDYVTNGPFTLEDWRHNEEIVMKKNPAYWDVANVALDKVTVGMVEKEDVATTMFKSGEIDFLGAPYQSVALNTIEEFKKQGALHVAPQTAHYVFKMNTEGKYTSNKNIRRALALAIDRQGLIDNVTKGEQIPALGLVPPTVPGFEQDRGYFKDNDIEGAKEALVLGLQELGLKEPADLKIGLSFNTSEAHAAIAQYVQEGWRKNLGIEVKLDNSEWQVYLEKVNNLDYDVARMGWVGDYKDAFTFMDMYATKDHGNNDTGWENPEYKKLIADSAKEVDQEKRLAILKQAEEIAMTEFPVAPLYYYTSLYVEQDYVKGMVVDPIGKIQLKNVDIVK